MALNIRPSLAVFFTTCSMLLMANQSSASGGEASALSKCESSALGPRVGLDELKRYSGYYRLNNKTFWHIVPASRGLYVIINDASVVPLMRAAAGGGFCFGRSGVENFFFSLSADGTSNAARLHVDASENYVMDEKGLRTQVRSVPAHDMVAPRVEKEVALSIYAKLKLARRTLDESRAPQPTNLSRDVDNKIKSYIIDQIQANDKVDPYSLAEGDIVSIEYLGVSPQGEYVLKVMRERFVGYWRIVFGRSGQVKYSSMSSSL